MKCNSMWYCGQMLAMAACVIVAGCGTNNPPTTQVSGRVTFNGGVMPSIGVVCFTPADGAGNCGVADFGTDGAFRASTWTPGDGLRPGIYHVTVECMKTPRTGVSDGTSHIHRKFNQSDPIKSGLPIVEVGKTPIRDLTFDVSPPATPEVERTRESTQPRYQP
ncbi:MAG: hypothetical protein ACRC46_07885 [Thermoguttaceae bacterium]